jgi:hypothetical protein
MDTGISARVLFVSILHILRLGEQSFVHHLTKAIQYANISIVGPLALRFGTILMIDKDQLPQRYYDSFAIGRVFGSAFGMKDFWVPIERAVEWVWC